MRISDLSNVMKVFQETELSEAERQQLFKEVLLMTLARASSSDANINPYEVSTIQEILERYTGQKFSEADIRVAARSELYEKAPLKSYLSSARRKLGGEDRVAIVKALEEVINSDEEVSVLEIEYFNSVAKAMKLSPAELVGMSRSRKSAAT